MARPSRSLVALLQAFVEGRRGLRLGSLFGAPAVFAGRRVAIRIDGDALDVRLAPAGRDFAKTLLRGRVVAGPSGWLRLLAPRDAQGVTGYLTVFERAVRDVAAA
ncbi:MAG: hypothetical protein IT181_04040 [Acidobacteria bacterium]|nr:hypothetical protein [Acidobacteriota bacterium]